MFLRIYKSFTSTPKILVRGFTLIELMVVVFIIMLLSGLVIVNLNQARARARDRRRISELYTVAAALEAYYSDYKYYVINEPPDDCTLDVSRGPYGHAYWRCNYYPGSKNNYLKIVQELSNKGYLTTCPEEENLKMDNPCSDTLKRGELENDWGYRFTCWDKQDDGRLTPCVSYALGTHLETDSGTGSVKAGCIACPVARDRPLGCLPIPEGPEYRIQDGKPAAAACSES